MLIQSIRTSGKQEKLWTEIFEASIRLHPSKNQQVNFIKNYVEGKPLFSHKQSLPILKTIPGPKIFKIKKPKLSVIRLKNEKHVVSQFSTIGMTTLMVTKLNRLHRKSVERFRQARTFSKIIYNQVQTNDIREKMLRHKRPSSVPRVGRRPDKSHVIEQDISSEDFKRICGLASQEDQELREARKVVNQIKLCDERTKDYLLMRRKSCEGVRSGGRCFKQELFYGYPSLREVVYSFFVRELMIISKQRQRNYIYQDYQRGVHIDSKFYSPDCGNDDDESDINNLKNKELINKVKKLFIQRPNFEKYTYRFLQKENIDSLIPEFLLNPKRYRNKNNLMSVSYQDTDNAMLSSHRSELSDRRRSTITAGGRISSGSRKSRGKRNSNAFNSQYRNYNRVLKPSNKKKLLKKKTRLILHILGGQRPSKLDNLTDKKQMIGIKQALQKKMTDSPNSPRRVPLTKKFTNEEKSKVNKKIEGTQRKKSTKELPVIVMSTYSDKMRNKFNVGQSGITLIKTSQPFLDNSDKDSILGSDSDSE